MTLTVLRDGTYHKKPWKNGGGITEDVWVLPDASSQDDFDIRLSLATIDRDGPFSAFPGIDRTITLVGGDPFVLDFGNGHQHRMEMLQPFSFDSSLTPSSKLILGPSRDFNVMTRSGRWRHEVRVLDKSMSRIDLTLSTIAIIHMAIGSSTIRAVEQASLSKRDTALIRQAEHLQVELEPGSAALLSNIQPFS